jgi:DNA-directed RNA polymerase subunit delta
MTLNYSNMSMLEVAETLMMRKKTPQSFKKIAQEVSELMGLSEQELQRRMARFYADLTLSGKFVNVGGDKWDLKYRQKFEIADLQFQYEEDEVAIDDSFGTEEEEEDEEEELDDEFDDGEDMDEDFSVPDED